MLTLKVKHNNAVLAEISNQTDAQLLYEAEYKEGDSLYLECDTAPCYIYLQLEDTMPLCLVYLKDNKYELSVPFGEARSSYCAKSFTGARQYLRARMASEEEISAHRDLALNPYDCHANTSVYPHAKANVETRGEAVFAARNAINGNTSNAGHGVWPYESWGIQRREDAEYIVDFGRTVEADGIGITIRCDFPHDNYWHHASIEFSDGSREILALEKKSATQYFAIANRNITWAKLCEMKKDETDESPFPALTAISVYGKSII